MKLKKLICRFDGSEELVESEVPDDWAAVPADVPEESVKAEKT